MTQNRGRSAQSPGAVSDASVRANHRSLVRISQEVLALAETSSRFDETSCCSAAVEYSLSALFRETRYLRCPETKHADAVRVRLWNRRDREAGCST
mmetsp:Transcript_12605/g.50643  ORF Transcript_12605/g.50643 Transcript_12605/m.50643 type:complete len:96 (-) Transcript_12605:168-455(-)